MHQDMWRHDITPQDIENFAKKYGPRKTNALLAVLGTNSPVWAALQTEVGQALFKGAAARADELAAKLIDDKISEDERIEFRVLKNILIGWSERVNAYKKYAKALIEG